MPPAEPLPGAGAAGAAARGAHIAGSPLQVPPARSDALSDEHPTPGKLAGAAVRAGGGGGEDREGRELAALPPNVRQNIGE